MSSCREDGCVAYFCNRDNFGWHYFWGKDVKPQIWYNELTDDQSQHLFDPWTFDHISAGMIQFLIIPFGGPHKNDTSTILTWYLVNLGVHIGWELLENSPLLIWWFRQLTTEKYLFGDSVINSISDAFIAFSIGWWITYVAWFIIEDYKWIIIGVVFVLLQSIATYFGVGYVKKLWEYGGIVLQRVGQCFGCKCCLCCKVEENEGDNKSDDANAQV